MDPRHKWHYYNSMDDTVALAAAVPQEEKSSRTRHSSESNTYSRSCYDHNDKGLLDSHMGGVISTDLPSRLDELPFSAYHWLLVFSLGITWMLDGLEMTVVSVVSAQLKREDTLALTDFQVGLAGSAYLTGAILGSLCFGYLCDRYGRKRLYLTTPIVYSLATGLSAFSWEFYGFALLRFITGAGLGGEYSAMNSAIDELIPARVRGRVDLAVNGSYWLGAAIAAAGSLFILEPVLWGSADFGWRFMFGMGAFLGVIIIIFRLFLPESPRWLITRGRIQEAQGIVEDIERKAAANWNWNSFFKKEKHWKSSKDLRHKATKQTYFTGGGNDNEACTNSFITIRPRKSTPIREVLEVMLVLYSKHTILGLSLMISQAFFYNAVFFSYAIILTDFYGVSSSKVGLYLVPFAVGNFLGPVTLGRLFDTVGRKKMIAFTYTVSSLLLIATGLLFSFNLISATVQTLLWSVIFFFSSPAASAAYLTVSEIFPLEVRALAISFFYSMGTGLGGVVAPLLFGYLLETEQAINIFYGYLVAASLMLAAATVEVLIGVNAEQRSLEQIAPPLSSLVDIPAVADDYCYQTTTTIESSTLAPQWDDTNERGPSSKQFQG